MVLWLWFEFGLTQKEPLSKQSKKRYKDVRKLAKSLLKQPESRFVDEFLEYDLFLR